MALTYSPQTETNNDMPRFELLTVDGKTWNSHTIEDSRAKIFVFMCNHCPYVKAIEKRLIRLATFLKTQGIPLIGICSNDPKENPEDSPQALLDRWNQQKYSFPYLIDSQQNVAKLFGAVCTPDIFVYNKNNKLSYRGRLDDSWKDESKVKNEDLRMAALAIAEGQPLPFNPIPSMGCSIKWLN